MEKSQYVQWFCGFYEGEGWVSNDTTNNNRLRLGIAQNDRTPLDIAVQLWGGNIKTRVRKSPASEKICVGYEWILSHNRSLVFLQDIEPFMMIPYKKEQVRHAIERSKVGLVRRFKCKQCEQDYASPSGRRRHELAAHSPLKEKSCEE